MKSGFTLLVLLLFPLSGHVGFLRGLQINYQEG